ncbi:hypothetical protein M404DRAFT_996576 [Pisolithus tinctorius Marx 270]|uniref:Uncharacterized protein n=1 Tax=Pisolithus tinctorius Marx 270 TaxID=870435 RepID=A0A0C3PMZ1_PISTI|nr:hypothetical protein M404DRAFT_996576 [Pisolithus tinctorius Marx 270]
MESLKCSTPDMWHDSPPLVLSLPLDVQCSPSIAPNDTACSTQRVSCASRRGSDGVILMGSPLPHFFASRHLGVSRASGVPPAHLHELVHLSCVYFPRRV